MLFEESLDLARRLDAAGWVAQASCYLGNLAVYDDDFAEALRLYEQPRAYYREVGDVRSLARAQLLGASEHAPALAL